jgi:hypothetical protein
VIPAPAILGLAVTLGCAPALRTPKPIGTLGGPPPGAPGRSAAALLADARAALARRPDVAQVRRAESLYVAAAQADPAGVEGLYGAIEAKVWLLDHDRSADRGALARSAVDAGQWCLRRAPASAWCDYGLAQALGMQAQEERSTALDGLKRMVELLRRAATEDPAIDRAGPERVLALVLARAPAWPLGPGDPESAVQAARKAVARAPDFAPNPLALGEALIATGASEEGRAEAERGLALARASHDPDAPEWIKNGEALVERAARPGSSSATP